MPGMRRREFVTLLGGAAAAWPLVARAQQPAMPVVGFLNAGSPDTYADRLRAFRQGLSDTGYVEGRNMAIEYRWAEKQIDRMPALAAELVRRPVAVIVAAEALLPASPQAATSTIPIVFAAARTRSRHGLVSSLARPSGNLTGINILIGELAAKRYELLRELVPKAVRLAVLLNPTDAASAETTMKRFEIGNKRYGTANSNSQCQHLPGDRCSFRQFCKSGLMRYSRHQPLFSSRRVQLALLAAHHSMPAIYRVREIVEVGGLRSYGINLADAGVRSASIRSHPQGRETNRPAGRAVDQVRAGHQPSTAGSALPCRPRCSPAPTR